MRPSPSPSPPSPTPPTPSQTQGQRRPSRRRSSAHTVIAAAAAAASSGSANASGGGVSGVTGATVPPTPVMRVTPSPTCKAWEPEWTSLESSGFPGFVKHFFQNAVPASPATIRSLLDNAGELAAKLEPINFRKFGYHVNIGLSVNAQDVPTVNWIRLRVDVVTFAIAVGMYTAPNASDAETAAMKKRRDAFASFLRGWYMVGFSEDTAEDLARHLPTSQQANEERSKKPEKEFDNLMKVKKEALDRNVRRTKKEDVDRLGVWGRLPKMFDETTIQRQVTNWKVVAVPDRQMRPMISLKFHHTFIPEQLVSLISAPNASVRGWELLASEEEKELLCEELVATWMRDVVAASPAAPSKPSVHEVIPHVQVEMHGRSWCAANAAPHLFLKLPFSLYRDWLVMPGKGCDPELWNGTWTIEEAKKYAELECCQYAREDVAMLFNFAVVEKNHQNGGAKEQ
ncbi:hypothetical protein BJ742DRAFT_455335 [Cladochytrium replicatum]|nr:hypothetical protein BJ742DRAFT_455335 [Cladochytrium replicatum]